MTCIRCGSTHHRVSNCPWPGAAARGIPLPQLEKIEHSLYTARLTPNKVEVAALCDEIRALRELVGELYLAREAPQDRLHAAHLAIRGWEPKA